MAWGALLCTIGWILRCFASFDLGNKNLYITQTVFILAGPPVFAAAEYNVLGRLMKYIPMHAFINPNRVVIVFIYLGAAVEGLTAAGASMMATAGNKQSKLHQGATYVAIGVVLQGAVELVFVSFVGVIHYRCAKSNLLTHDVRKICILLYGTSSLVLARCIFRAIEEFSIAGVLGTKTCNGLCSAVLRHEWYIYVFDAAPMVVFTCWFNLMHPGKILPSNSKQYLDYDQKVRMGPGWTDNRSIGATYLDPCNFQGKYDKFWLRPDDWPIVADESGSKEATGKLEGSARETIDREIHV